MLNVELMSIVKQALIQKGIGALDVINRLMALGFRQSFPATAVCCLSPVSVSLGTNQMSLNIASGVCGTH